MRLNQLTEVDMEGLEQSVQGLLDRYTQLFGDQSLTEQHVDWGMVIQALKQALMKSEHTDYDSIDTLMKSICAQHGCDPHELHDQFLDAEDITPDEWIHTLRS